MSRFTLIATMVVIATTFVSGVSAADTATPTPGADTSTEKSTTPLLLDAVSVSELKSIDLIFNQAIRVDSIRVRVIDQATNESVKIASITGPSSGAADSAAVIHTASPLMAGASYVLTITSALSMTEMTIKAGVDSIREFTVPASLATVTTLNAPSNPSAVIASTGTTDPKPTPTTPAPVVLPVPQTTEALPEAGTSSTYLVILAAISALGLLLLRKRA